MFTTKTIQGTTNPNSGTKGPAPIELGIAAKHSVVGADFCKENGDGSYTLDFPSVEHYQDFLDELAGSSEDQAIITDVLRRHGA